MLRARRPGRHPAAQPCANMVAAVTGVTWRWSDARGGKRKTGHRTRRCTCRSARRHVVVLRRPQVNAGVLRTAPNEMERATEGEHNRPRCQGAHANVLADALVLVLCVPPLMTGIVWASALLLEWLRVPVTVPESELLFRVVISGPYWGVLLTAMAIGCASVAEGGHARARKALIVGAVLSCVVQWVLWLVPGLIEVP
jgi:hypothetical protein